MSGTAGRAFADEFIVVAPVAVNLTVANFQNLIEPGVEKFPVVGNCENGSGIVAEVVLESDERLRVEVVGGFVQHEWVRLQHRETGQNGRAWSSCQKK